MIFWISFGGTVANPGTAPTIWEANGTTLGVVDAPFSDWQVTTEAAGLWPSLGASVNTGKAQRHELRSSIDKKKKKKKKKKKGGGGGGGERRGGCQLTTTFVNGIKGGGGGG